MNDQNQLLKFLHFLSKLKSILRFKGMPYWENTSVERWDSVAEHTYRMAILAIMLQDKVDTSFNLEKTLKIILIHDWVEMFTGDEFPFTKKGDTYIYENEPKETRYNNDLKAFNKLVEFLPNEYIVEFRSLFTDFINAQASKQPTSQEAVFAVALDRIESTLTCTEYKKAEGKWDPTHKKLQTEYLTSKVLSHNQKLKDFVEELKKEIEVS